MDKVKLGFVGCGFMGQMAHLSNFVESEKCEVVALAEKRRSLRDKVAQKYHISRVYSTHEELCQDKEIDAVVEITSDALHSPIAIDLMNAGKHVFTEKPMATNLADATKMVEASEKNKVKLVIGYMKRYDPGVEKAKKSIGHFEKTKEMGKVTFIRSHCFEGDWICNIGEPIRTDEEYPRVAKAVFPEWLPPEFHKEFKYFNNVYCHNINLLRFLLKKKMKVKEVYFTESTKVVLFDMEGIATTLETGDISANFWDEELKVYYEDGWVELIASPPLLKNVPARLRVYKAGRIQEIIESYLPWDWSFRRANEDFLDCILRDRESRSSGKDSLEDVRIVEEIFKKYMMSF
ncbi:Inositol 2-dehydrogenase/D-chiro-inositol 3-dehydrogenase [subsurface metagenome]|jgi:predicted dehydrogenase